MIFATKNFGSTLITRKLVSSTCETVRWLRYRKPFWLGVAKSKRFIIPQKKEMPSDDYNEYQRLKIDYNISLNSLNQFIKIHNPALESVKSQSMTEEVKIKKTLLEKKINESIIMNEIWNAQSAEFRENRIKNLSEQKVEMVAKKIAKEEEKTKLILERLDNIIKNEKEMSKTYITLENLEEAIEKCLDNVSNFNFAIDLNGTKYYGSDTLIDNTTNTKKMAEVAE